MYLETGSSNLNIMIKAVQYVSKTLLRDFGEIQQLQNSKKGVDSFVKATKKRAEKILLEELTNAKVKYGYLTPFSKKKGSDISHNFIVQVLCGEENFKRGVPHFAISVALQEQNKIVGAVVYNPALDFLYYAEKGQGAYFYEARSSRRVRVNVKTSLNEALISVSSQSEKVENSLRPKILKALVEDISFETRFSGCPALELVYTADNKYDAFIGFNESLFNMAASMLIYKEAGGTIQSFDSNKNKVNDIFYSDLIVSGSEKLSKDLLKKIWSVI